MQGWRNDNLFVIIIFYNYQISKIPVSKIDDWTENTKYELSQSPETEIDGFRATGEKLKLEEGTKPFLW